MKHTARETWLQEAIGLLDKEFFEGTENTLPKNIRVSCGFPKNSNTAIGQCFPIGNSEDQTFEIFICPTQASPIRVLDVLLHEMIHTVLEPGVKHGKPFRDIAQGFGFAGRMTATIAEEGSPLYEKLEEVSKELGPYPHAPMIKKKRKAQPNNWVRFVSPEVDTFKVVVSMIQVNMYGPPKDPWGKDMSPVGEVR